MNELKMDKNQRIVAIDGLRGICALIVVIGHFMVGFFPSSYWGEGSPSHTLYNIDTYLAQSPLSLFYAGNYAVNVFFVISGFVLSRNFYIDDKIDKTATNRYLRLCLPIFISTLIIFIFMKLSLFKSIEASSITGSIWLSSLYNFTPDFKEMLSITLFDVFFIGNSKYNVVCWMISILFYGSFLSICIMKLWGNMKNRRIIYFILIIVFYKLNIINYIAFILGIICADLAANYKSSKNKIDNNLFGIGMIAFGVYLGCYPSGIIPTNIFYTWLNIGEKSVQIYHVIGAFMLVLGILNSEKVQRVLSKRVFLYLGKISFSIFLVHIIVLCSFSCSVFIKVWSLTQKYQFAFIVTFSLSIIIIIVFSHLFYKFVEQNSNKVISIIYNKFFIY